ncbi:hypothetical protein DFH06DRAFT_1135626 [Mycena polygramma]|nr:hypothetical protein DFH06DRAFT_1135626 [Mycena polygramma]
MNSLHCHYCGAIRFAKSGRKPLSDFKAAPGTRHHALLNSNEAPLGPDVTIIQSTISKIDEHMAELDAEAPKSCSSFTRKEDPPWEIVSWTPRRGRRKTRMKDSPWFFTHVSQYWRAVAVSHSKLWSLVAIQYQPGTNPSAYPLAMVETQLARAKKLKIQFSGCQTSNAGLQTEMFRYLSKHASRWEELSLALTSDLYPILNDLRGRVPSLCRVSLRWDHEESQAGADPIDFLKSVPSLVDVDVLNKHRYVPVSLPSQQLTRYRLYAPWEIHEGLLKLASNLVEAGISVNSDASLGPESGEIIEIPSVRRLYASTPQVFCRIRVPALDELWISPHNRCGGFEVSRCPLGIISILQNVPSAVELRVSITNASVAHAVNNLIGRLNVLPGSTAVIPQLSSLCLAWTTAASKSYFDYAALFKMAESRWNSQQCALSHATLIFRTPPDSGTPSLADFDILRNDGFNLVLVTDAVTAIDTINDWGCFIRFGDQ